MEYALPSGKTTTFPAHVAYLAKPGDAILDSLTGDKVHAWHMASCIPGEAGELFTPLAGYIFRNDCLDTENVIEELGDIEFYSEGLRAALSITRLQVFEAAPLIHYDMVENTNTREDFKAAVLALPARAADVFDAVKKWVLYNKPFDRAALVSALASLHISLEAIRDHFNISLDQILAANVMKLGVRYADGYSDLAAQVRADKTVH